MLATRVWIPREACEINEYYDMQQSGVTNYIVPTLGDVSVINVLTIPEKMEGWCVFNVLDMTPNGNLQNALFVVNASIDLGKHNCRTPRIALIDTMIGYIQNLSVIGMVNLTNIPATTYSIVASMFF
jgi:hypothetical protein